LDGMRLARWQAEALQTVGGEAEFVLYSCTTPAPTQCRLRHALYYLLNLFTVRNRMTRKVGLPADLIVVATRTLAAEGDGAWQSLPPDLIATIAVDRLAVPILSYHHGDPAKFRGRPAGFYELQRGEPTVGQVVQVLSNALDSGQIVASGETPAIGHSYRATLIEAYRHSPL